MGKYLPLNEATKYCKYSQEYLGLRARQGKLKSVKIGRNWVTTLEWLNEYLEKNNGGAQYFENGNAAIKNEVKTPEITQGIKISSSIKEKSRLIFDFLVPSTQKSLSLLLALVIFAFIGFIFIPQIEIQNFPENIFAVINNGESNKAAVGDIFNPLVGVFAGYEKWVSKRFSCAGSFVKKAGDNLNNLVYNFVFPSSQPPTFVVGVPAKNAGSTPAPETNQKGLVVIPATAQNEEMINKIKQSFSDEVSVKPKDQSSGIITPIFKSGQGEDYLYLLVPVKN